jgi:hypothetical protein
MAEVIIEPGQMVGFQFGLESVKAEVLGTVRDGEQYLLMLEYVGKCPETNQENVLVRRLFQRDRKFINSFNPDIRFIRDNVEHGRSQRL